MLKYLLAIVAGAAGLFLGVFLAVLVVPDAGTLHGAFGAGCAIGAARLVYGFFRKREDAATPGLPEQPEQPALQNSDVKNFTKAFSGIDTASLGISEVRIAEREDQQSFCIGIRAADFSQIDQQVILRPLKKMYYAHIQFVIVDLNSENAALLSNGTNIPLPKQ